MVLVKKVRSGLTKKQAASFLAEAPAPPADQPTLPQKKAKPKRKKHNPFHQHDWTVLLADALIPGKEAALVPGEASFPEKRKLPVIIAQVHTWARRHGIVIKTRSEYRPSPRVMVRIIGKVEKKKK